MCWIGTLESKKIADKDIYCKKIIAYHPTESYYYPFYVPYGNIKRQKVGDTYTSEIAIKNITRQVDKLQHCEIHNGLHCYNWNIRIEPFRCDDGSHIMVTLNNYNSTIYYWHEPQIKRFPVLVHCMIPKGATYYENEYGEIVTDTLKILGTLKLEK